MKSRLWRKLLSKVRPTKVFGFKGQIVFQWPAESMKDLDRIVAIENKIRRDLGSIGSVDGHDIGAGEMNVFIYTDDPNAVLEKAMSLLKGEVDMEDLMVGFRKFDEDDYRPMYPPGLEFFRVA